MCRRFRCLHKILPFFLFIHQIHIQRYGSTYRQPAQHNMQFTDTYYKHTRPRSQSSRVNQKPPSLTNRKKTPAERPAARSFDVPVSIITWGQASMNVYFSADNVAQKESTSKKTVEHRRHWKVSIQRNLAGRPRDATP